MRISDWSSDVCSSDLIERANTTGDKLRAALLDLAASTSAIAEVRGLGAMIAVEFHHPEDKTPNPELAAAIQQKALRNGLVLLTCGVYEIGRASCRERVCQYV